QPARLPLLRLERRAARPRRVSQLRFRRRAAGGLPEGRGAGAQPGTSSHGSDHGRLRLRPPLPSADERREPPDEGTRPRLLAHGPPRDHAAAPGCGADRVQRRVSGHDGSQEHGGPPMRLSDFDFHLPEHLIAQEPPAERGSSRLLVVDRRTGRWSDARIADLPSHLASGDLLVVNNSRVIPARLLGHRVPSGGRVECLLLRRLDDRRWDVLLHPGQKMKPGTRARFGEPPHVLELEVLSQHTFGRRTVTLTAPGGVPVDAVIDAIGHMPLPPYIKRPDTPTDRDRYQTIYATRRGSVAAPTAG